MNSFSQSKNYFLALSMLSFCAAVQSADMLDTLWRNKGKIVLAGAGGYVTYKVVSNRKAIRKTCSDAQSTYDFFTKLTPAQRQALPEIPAILATINRHTAQLDEQDTQIKNLSKRVSALTNRQELNERTINDHMKVDFGFQLKQLEGRQKSLEKSMGSLPEAEHKHDAGDLSALFHQLKDQQQQLEKNMDKFETPKTDLTLLEAEIAKINTSCFELAGLSKDTFAQVKALDIRVSELEGIMAKRETVQVTDSASQLLEATANTK